ncbi:uncharacterized protein [Spinacia oleracea]|uniref:DUF4283 domain-containing protein n=1 Tax=Spinacia oleracea TaxID=3562 RepID=A0ABM3RPP9_SPIOL|nr:uncharacterized protein LOC130471470 [Spinacia oleracea]
MFAKILVEVCIDQQFPSMIHFLNEKGTKVDQQVYYDWLPIMCTVCKGMGHDHSKCNKKNSTGGRKVWVKKTVQSNPTTKDTEVVIGQVHPVNTERSGPVARQVDSEGFEQAARFSKSKGQQLKPVVTGNSFMALDCEDEEDGSENGHIADVRHEKQKEVRYMIQSHNIKLFSLLETREKASKMGSIYLNLCPNWCFTTNPSFHNNGRIILAWDPDAFTVNIIHMGSQLIHCMITPRTFGDQFFASFVYGMNTPLEREELWSSLAALTSNTAWIIMGDFNAIMNMEDRVGAAVRTADIMPMRQCMARCKLTEVKTMGRHFTWTNKQEGVDRVFSRIDRVLANEAWGDLFDGAEATFLPEGTFDHCPMILTTFLSQQ